VKRRLPFRPRYLIVFGLLCLVGVYFLTSNGDQGSSDEPATVAGSSLTLDAPAAPRALASAWARNAPAVVREDKGHLQIVQAPQFDFQPLVGADPSLGGSETHVDLGESTKLRFAARDKTGSQKVGKVTASVSHGTDPVQVLEVEKVAEGVFEVPFTPTGPGQFNVVLSVDGAPAGFERVGVVGAVGASNGKTDGDLMAVDPFQFHARTPGRARTR
jgi:hypothetical protein